MNGRTCRVAMSVGMFAALWSCASASAQFGGRRGIGGPAGVVGGAGGGAITLPYNVQDNAGNSWQVYNGGWFRINGNMPLFSQGAMLLINGQMANQNVNQARLDPKTGEIVFDNVAANGCTVTRHVLIDKAGGYVRYIDVVKNTQAQAQTFQVMIQTTYNYGISAGQNVADPRKADQTLGWVGQSMANQSVVEMYAGKGAKAAASVQWPPGNNVVHGTVPLVIPAGKEAAVMHLHAIAPSQDAGSKFITDFKESALLKSIPPALRRLIRNFHTVQDFVGGTEILRGGVLDVVEIHRGDALKGTLKEQTYQLQTFWGHLALPADKVVGIINVGQFRPRQLVITSDGQIFGGQLTKQTLDLQLSSGQVIQVPLAEVSRLGYRQRGGEPQEWTFAGPIVMLRTGERIAVQMPTETIEVATRCGKLSLKPQQIAAILLQNEDNDLHEINLTDGSKFAGLLTADTVEMKLPSESGSEQRIKFPISAIGRLQFSAQVKETDDATPTIHLSNEDELVGTLSGKLRLATAFDKIDINSSEIKSLVHLPDDAADDVQVTLWDGTTLSGQVEEQALTCQLAGGVTLKAPVALVRQYLQPLPQPSDAIVQRIKGIVETDLTNEDWHVRDRAREQLMQMGPLVGPVLKQLRENQPPEAQKTIDIILAELAKQRKPQETSSVAEPYADD